MLKCWIKLIKNQSFQKKVKIVKKVIKIIIIIIFKRILQDIKYKSWNEGFIIN
jgi:hypothetical protein